jgi:hypothetical protein
VPQPEGKIFTLEETSSSSSSSNEIRSFEDIELNSPDLVRGVRNPDNNLEVIRRLGYQRVTAQQTQVHLRLS